MGTGKGKVTAAEVAAYAKENEPRAKVISYGWTMSKCGEEGMNALTHDWLETRWWDQKLFSV